jgi:nitrogen fixation/metabolism regulation signal transduction histidine kinase
LWRTIPALVLGDDVKLLTNPLVIRMAAVLIAASFAFVAGMLLMKYARRRVEKDLTLGEGDPDQGAFPLHTYSAVIQQLKQQKHELQSLQQQERRRAKTTENVSAAVLSNLSCGVLFFNTAGLVRQANPAAKNILGFASPIGMNADELFRGATLLSPGAADEQVETIGQAVSAALQSAATFRNLEADYLSPAGRAGALEITVSPVYAANADVLGVTCLVNDQTEMVQMRKRQQLSGEVSAEIGLALRTSLSAISEYARRLAAAADPQAAEQLAADIAAEARHLEHSIGSFLADAGMARTSSSPR